MGSKQQTQGSRGKGESTYALWEELKHLRVEPTAQSASIYKRLDGNLQQPLEERPYQVYIPVKGGRGRRKSLRVSGRLDAISRAEEEVVELKVQLRQGGSIVRVSAEELVNRFLRDKATRIRGEWEGKDEAGTRSITRERYQLIEGKLRNYLVGFLGAKTDIKTVSANRWNDWAVWRIENNRKGSKPKASTLQTEMGMIRECWRWAMENSLIPLAPKLPFHQENLVLDDKVRRDTWEPSEWNSFARRIRDWLKEQETKAPDDYWDAWVAYQMLFLLANSGMRVGEVVKVKRKDIKFYERDDKSAPKHKLLCALIQVHPATKTGAREVNAMGGIFPRRVWEKSKFKTKNDFLFCHLDGTPFTTKQFRTQFNRMITFTRENERLGKVLVPYSLRHLYATIRLQHGTSLQSLCENMGSSEPYLRKHYSHFLTRLATADLMKMRKDIGLGGDFISDGKDFVLPEMG